MVSPSEYRSRQTRRRETNNYIHDEEEEEVSDSEDMALLRAIRATGYVHQSETQYLLAIEEFERVNPTAHRRAIARARSRYAGGGKKSKSKSKSKSKIKSKSKSKSKRTIGKRPKGRGNGKGKRTKLKRVKSKKNVTSKRKFKGLDKTFTRRDEIQDGTLFCKVFPIARSMGLVTNKRISDADYTTAVNKFARLYPNAYPRAVARHRARMRNSKNKRAKKKTTRKQAAKNKLAGTTYRPNCP